MRRTMKVFMKPEHPTEQNKSPYFFYKQGFSFIILDVVFVRKIVLYFGVYFFLFRLKLFS